VTFNAYYANTRTPLVRGHTDSYQATFSYAPDLYGFSVSHLFVGDAFNPEVGFVRRDDMRQTSASARFSPRPRRSRTVRQFTFSGNLDYILNTSGVLETRSQYIGFNTEFHNSDHFTVSVNRDQDLLLRPFAITPQVTIPAGTYDFTDLQVSYSIGPQKRWNGTLSLSRGSYYDGTRTVGQYTAGRLAVTPRLAVEPGLSINWIDLPYGAFTTQLYTTRVTYTISPRTFVAGFLQYNSSNHTATSNIRLRWEYSPGSELFVVYSDDRDTNTFGRASTLINRAIVIKINRLFRF
jgi:hypothetical protein